MASQACQKSVPVEDLLQRARSKGISAHGEMFSAEAMADFATEMLKGVKASVRRSVLESPSEVIKILLEGDLILFPYPFAIINSTRSFLESPLGYIFFNKKSYLNNY